jgi:hypothetical protein
MVNAAARAMLEGRGELTEFLMREVRQRREFARSFAHALATLSALPTT